MTEDKMVGWHHQLNGHEFEQALGDGEGQESLTCCSPWGRKDLEETEQVHIHMYMTDNDTILSYCFLENASI